MSAQGCLTAWGMHDSHAITLSDGRPNGSPRAGTPYQRITWQAILALADTPGATPKHSAQLFIPSTYAEHDGRGHEVQAERGEYHALAVDIDKGNPDLATLVQAVVRVYGDVEALFYSSSGASADLQKWRVILPLAQPIPGAVYRDTQKAAFALLERQGITPDTALDRTGQPVFLPNVPPDKRGPDGAPLFYRTKHHAAPRLCLTAAHPIIAEREARRAKAEKAARIAKEKAERFKAEKLAYVAATGDDFDPIPHFNAHHPIADMLARYGFEHKGRDNWTSPLSESGSASTRNYGTHWVAVSSWASNHGVGHETPSGNHAGDAFDLYAHFEHGGDKRGAIRAYAQEVRPDAPTPEARIVTALQEAVDKPAPTYSIPTGTVDQARDVIAAAFEEWQLEAANWLPDPEAPTPAKVWGLRVTTGVGKSYAARRAAVATARRLKEKGDSRPVVLFVPRHKLGDEYLEDLNETGLSVQVYRGMNQPDPEAEGELMCRRADEAEMVRRAGADPTQTLCKSGDEYCPFYTVCGTRRQKGARADIWIAPHNLLWRQPPACIGSPAAVVVDEDPSGGMFAGFDARPYQLSIDDLKLPFAGLGPFQNADLTAVTGAILRAADATAPGDQVDPRELPVSGADIGAARAIVFKAKLAPPCGPSTPFETLKHELAKIADQNRRVTRIARLLDIVRTAKEDGASIIPGLVIAEGKTDRGNAFKLLRLRWMEKVAPGWNAPTVVASATVSDTTIKTLWPHMDDCIEASAAMPHVQIRQITDMAMGGGSLAPDETAPPSTLTYSRRLRARIRRYIEHRAARVRGKVLVVAQERVLKALGDFPSNIGTVHFNALSGLDRFKDVRLIIQLGRTLPSPTDIEARAELVAGDAIERVSGWYEKRPATLTMANGDAGPAVFTRAGKGQELTLGTDRHPEPIAEAIRWGICEGELLQALGRGRGVNRTAETPLQVDILTNVPLPLPVNEAGTFQSFEPTPEELLQDRGFAIPDTSAKGAWALIAAILPDVFKNPNAARCSWKAQNVRPERSRGENPISIHIGIIPRERLSTVKLKPEGARYGLTVLTTATTEAELLTALDPYPITFEGVLTVPELPPDQGEGDCRHETPPRRLTIDTGPPATPLQIATNAPSARPPDRAKIAGGIP